MAALTRAAVEFEVIDRVGGLWRFVNLAGASLSLVTNGTNPNLAGPIAQAMLNLSYTPLDPTNPVDADIQNIDQTQFYSLVELTYYYAIKKGLGNYTKTNETAQDRKQEWATLRALYSAEIVDLEQRYQGLINIRRAPTIVGNFAVNFPTPNLSTWALGDGRYDH